MSQWWIALFSEFVGTALLILLGNGVVASTHFKRMFANQSGKWIVIALGWGLAVFSGVIVSAAMGGSGYLNPAVLIMDAVGFGKSGALLNASNNVFGLGYLALQNASAAIAATFFVALIFQVSGAMFGQAVLNFMNFKFLTDKENEIMTIRGCHATGPAYNNKQEKATIFNFSYELIGTLVLLGVILGIGKDSVGVKQYNVISVALLVTAIGLSIGSATGYAINPARDFGPRVVYYYFIKKFRNNEAKSVSDFANWTYSWVPVVAPMTAGIIMGLIKLGI